MRYLLILLLVSFSAPKALFAQDNNDATIQNAIDKNAHILLKNKEINSISLGVYKDGKIFIGHFGELEKGKGNTPSNETIYEIASVTKTMIGFLVAKAEKEGKITLDDDIRMYLKGAYPNLEFNGKPITIRYLITHTGGLPAFLPFEMNEVFENLTQDVPQRFQEIEENYTQQKFFDDLKKVEIKAEPGISFQYSNVGAELMGHILETVYEKSVEVLLQEQLFQKAGMTSTSITISEAAQQHLAFGYWMDNKTVSPSELNTLWASASGVKSTLPDLINYIKFQLDTNNDLVNKTHQVLFQAGKTLKLGYFWRIWTDKYGTSYNHHGGNTGTQNWIYLYPKYNIGITIITNHSGPDTPNKLSETVKKMLKEIIKK